MNKEDRNSYRKEMLGKLEEHNGLSQIAPKTTSSITTLLKIKSSFLMPCSG